MHQVVHGETEVDVSEDQGAERAPREEGEPPSGEGQDEQVVGDDESSYGGAGQSDAEDADHVDPGSGQNRAPSEQDEDQGI